MPSPELPTPTALRDELQRTDGWRATRRLVAALLYACGHSGPELATVFDVREATVYAWLDRFGAADDLGAAATDRPRPGRPPRIGPDALAALLAALAAPPASCGYASERWTPGLLRRVLAEEFGVEYSVRHARRLLAEAEGRGAALVEGSGAP